MCHLEEKNLFLNMALFAQKISKNIFLSISVSGYFKTKQKVPMAIKPRRAGKGLSGRATKKKTFFAAAPT